MSFAKHQEPKRKTRIERIGNMLIEQPVGQQWWDNPTPEAEVVKLPTIDQMPKSSGFPLAA